MKLHTVLLLASLVVLPIIPAVHWKPTGDENPSWLILGMLAATIGLPYFLLSTTSPLVQAWFSRAKPGASPYRLFALSNLASMLALRRLPVPAGAVGADPRPGDRLVGRLRAASSPSAPPPAGRACGMRARRRSCAGGTAAAGPGLDRDEPPPTLSRQLLWCTLAATGSILLLAVSNHITQNVAAVPLLWLAPLALYLLTFILCFDSTGWYRREPILSMVAAATRRDGVDAGRPEADARARHPDRRLPAAGSSSRACSATASSSGSSRRRAG